MTEKLINNDCLLALKKIPDNSIDSLITDPPAGISFMGKEWDSDKGGRDGWIKWMTEVMTEVKRVLKPGAHGLVWAIPRTSHWTATALENAGFGIRDVVTHLFGSGFPKSHDISKGIDKQAGVTREAIGLAVNSYPDSGRKDIYRKGGGKVFDQGDGVKQNVITAPTTDLAKQWQGWGTALKPASEHWILVRKPCSEKTVAANVQKWGTGGINIDASRVESPYEHIMHPQKVSTNKHEGYQRPWNNDPVARQRADAQKIAAADKCQRLGRYPANLVLSHSQFCTDDQCDIECAIKELDGQSGISKSQGGTKPIVTETKFGQTSGRPQVPFNFGDTGGASRFFYCAKISTSERGDGNTHPTVKPKKLMSYLIRMITPPGGVVLDPFMGSGSTGIAAKECGFEFIGIEKEKEYFEIAKARIKSCV